MQVQVITAKYLADQSFHFHAVAGDVRVMFKNVPYKSKAYSVFIIKPLGHQIEDFNTPEDALKAHGSRPEVCAIIKAAVEKMDERFRNLFPTPPQN